MKVWTLHEPVSIKKPVATIGIFDGVHTGHRFILEKLKEQAAMHGGESVVVTLWPHPRIVLNKDLQQFKLLHSLEEKIRQLEQSGIDHLVIIPFDKEIASLTACEFTQLYLVDHLGVEVLLVGYDNRFGRDRKGDPDGLALCADKNDFRIEKIPEFNQGDGKVSSTSIREAIVLGQMDKAETMLGYPYYLTGHVVEGNHIGRKMGFPTANIHPYDPNKQIPLNGVYAIRAELRNKVYGGMLNIGFRPTIDSASAVKTIEAHLFDVSGDFYGEKIVVHFIKRVRDEMKFAGLTELKHQLGLDQIQIQKLLHEN
ncbi:MAG: riboflavin biosynthesis protein RibF [Bacteroides sp.]|nr:riboflavin biosynthesis protein RibF [Bacteroides sp.]